MNNYKKEYPGLDLRNPTIKLQNVATGMAAFGRDNPFLHLGRFVMGWNNQQWK